MPDCIHSGKSLCEAEQEPALRPQDVLAGKQHEKGRRKSTDYRYPQSSARTAGTDPHIRTTPPAAAGRHHVWRMRAASRPPLPGRSEAAAGCGCAAVPLGSLRRDASGPAPCSAARVRGRRLARPRPVSGAGKAARPPSGARPGMAARRCAGGAAALAEAPGCGAAVEPARELFEACRNGDVERVKRLVRPENVNGRDTAGRKSSPLHFAAGTACGRGAGEGPRVARPRIAASPRRGACSGGAALGPGLCRHSALGALPCPRVRLLGSDGPAASRVPRVKGTARPAAGRGT